MILKFTKVQFLNGIPVALYQQLDALIGYFVFGYNLIYLLHKSKTLILGHSKFVIYRTLVSDKCCYAIFFTIRGTQE